MHHCAGSKRLSLQTFQMYLSLNAPQIFSLIFTYAANLSIQLSGSTKTSNCSPCFGVHISLYAWCPLIKVSRSKVVIKTIRSSSCKQIISVVILKGNIPIHNVQTCNDGFFLSDKIIQWNDAIAFFKTLFECFDWIFRLDESFYLQKVIYRIPVESSWQRLK